MTKYRRKVLDREALTQLHAICASVAADFGAFLHESNGEDDHLRLLVEYPAAVSVSALVNSLKGVSSRLLRRARPDLSHRYYRGALWSPSYFAASGAGVPLSDIRQYIEQQRKPVT